MTDSQHIIHELSGLQLTRAQEAQTSSWTATLAVLL
jgi:hypothetical protein